MGNELQTMQDLKTKIREKIKGSFVDMISEEAWKKLVDDEEHEFIQKELKGLIKMELMKHFQGEVKKELESVGWLQNWNGHTYVPGEAVKGIIKECAPELVQAMFSGVVDMAVRNIRDTVLRC